MNLWIIHHASEAKVLTFSTTIGSFIGAIGAMTLDLEVGALVLSGITILSGLVWAWLVGKLNNMFVKKGDCAAQHAVTASFMAEIKQERHERNKEIDQKFDRIHRELSHLAGVVEQALKEKR
jgi:polyhydroxyalkanoate synthesis regulator phasin